MGSVTPGRGDGGRAFLGFQALTKGSMQTDAHDRSTFALRGPSHVEGHHREHEVQGTSLHSLLRGVKVPLAKFLPP